MHYSTERFIGEAKEVHGDIYDYSLTSYVKSSEKVKIICPRHGVFEQSPAGHLKKKSCKHCAIEDGTLRIRFTLNQFIDKCNIVHNNKYSYSKSVYRNAHSKIKILCPTHGEFEQLAMNHLKGCGCSKCGESIFVKKVRSILEELGIKYSFNNRSIIKPKEIDFYLSDYKIGIEINDTWSHNSEDHPFSEPKDKYYHQNKTKECWLIGVRLIHLFENDIEDLSVIKFKEILNNIFNSKPVLSEPQILQGYSKLIYTDGVEWVS